MRDIIQMFTTGKKWTMSKEHGSNASQCLITITPIIILTFKTILFISNKLNSIYTVVEDAMLAPEDPITPSGLHRYCIYVLFRHLGRQKTHIQKL